MRVFWTLVKIVFACMLIVPAAIIAMAVALGVFGALLGLAIMTLRFAVAGLVVYGAWRLFRTMFVRSSRQTRIPEIKALPPVDPYYEAAKRELDRELGST
ncbi:MAG TPA: hypothetical protein VKH19_17595 [Gemmatimonadaceae bacterium]|nr:hypothetical protein [Gemmatimonadaceae bacterium]